MKTRKITLLLLYALCGCRGLPSAAQLSHPNRETVVHVAVRVRDLTGDPVTNLRSSNFTLLSSGKALAFRMEPAKLGHESCVLIVVAPGVTANLAAYLSAEVPEKLPVSYSLSAMGPDGAYVGHTGTRDELTERYRSGQYVYKGYEQAIDELAVCRGERSILYAMAHSARLPSDLIRAAERAEALIYEVGGDPSQNYEYCGEPGTTAPPTSVGAVALQTASVPGAETWQSSPMRSIRTVYVEGSMRLAFREIQRVSRGWYGVTLHSPRPLETLEVRAKLPGEYQIGAVDWLEAEGIAPALKLSR